MALTRINMLHEAELVHLLSRLKDQAQTAWHEHAIFSNDAIRAKRAAEKVFESLKAAAQTQRRILLLIRMMQYCTKEQLREYTRLLATYSDGSLTNFEVFLEKIYVLKSLTIPPEETHLMEAYYEHVEYLKAIGAGDSGLKMQGTVTGRISNHVNVGTIPNEITPDHQNPVLDPAKVAEFKTRVAEAYKEAKQGQRSLTTGIDFSGGIDETVVGPRTPPTKKK